MIELTDAAISKAIEKTATESKYDIRVGVTGGGCAGYEYFIEFTDTINVEDHIVDYGKFSIVIDKLSQPFLEGSTLDWIKEGLNEQFKIINPKETSSCGCGVSVSFKI